MDEHDTGGKVMCDRRFTQNVTIAVHAILWATVGIAYIIWLTL